MTAKRPGAKASKAVLPDTTKDREEVRTRFLAVAIGTLSLVASSAAQAEGTKMQKDMHMVAPGLEKYTQSTLLGEVWKRPGLSARDRSIVTLAALIARNQTIEMPFYLNLALDNGVKPREISVLHLSALLIGLCRL
jgi:alkylhydroperoxidase/carboxymuconolactone decarboxylase family protein YurZ